MKLAGLLGTEGDVTGAAAACQTAINSGEPDAAPRSAVMLGMLYAQQGNLAGARAAYQYAISSGHPEAARIAADQLRAIGG